MVVLFTVLIKTTQPRRFSARKGRKMAVFTPLDLSRWHSAGQEVSLWHPALSQRFAQMPGGALTAWGIPFALATDGDGAPRWIILGRDAQPLNLPLDEAAAATHVIVAHFCNTAQRPRVDPAGIPPGVVTRAGEHLADYVLV